MTMHVISSADRRHSGPQFLHASVAVADLDAAADFLVRSMGFTVDLYADDLMDEVARMTSRPGLTVRLAQFSRPGESFRLEMIEFLDPARGDLVPPVAAEGSLPLAHFAFAVADLDAQLESLEAAGAESLGEIVRFPEGRCVYMRAPGGMVIELEELSGEGSKAAS